MLGDGGVYMKSSEVFEAVISADGRTAICRMLGDVEQRAFEANLLNFIVSASLTLHGEETLHATVLEMDGRAVGLLGPSGAGKSTLAAYLISRGADLITDDMLRVSFTDDAILAYPGPYRLKLLDQPGHRLPARCRGRRTFQRVERQDHGAAAPGGRRPSRADRGSRPCSISANRMTRSWRFRASG